MNSTKVKVIELEKVELKLGAKYVICVPPFAASWVDVLNEELGRLIGRENFTVLPMQSLRIFEVLPQDAE